MREIRRIDSMKVRTYCIKNDYYTSGTCKEYENLLFNLCNTDCITEGITLDRIEEIAADILVHSVWEKKASAYGCNYDELLTYVMTDLINDCCTSFIEL